MRNRTLLLIAGITMLALLFVFSACPVDETGETVSGPEPFEGLPSGTASAEDYGFHGPITVEITMKDGIITDAKVDGPNETPGIGAEAVKRAPAKIIEKNSSEIDVLASATITTNGIKKACKAAIEKIIAASK